MNGAPRALRSLLSIMIVLLLAATSHALQWESIGPDGGRVDGFAQSRANPDRMYVLFYTQGVWRSDDRGANWNRVDVAPSLDGTYVAIAASSTDPNVVIVAPDGGNSILRSTNGGVDWESVVVAGGLSQVQDIEFDPGAGRNVLLAANANASVYRSTDAGETWNSSNIGFDSVPVQIAFHPSTAGTVLIGSSGGVFRSTNGGVSWTLSNMGGNTSARQVSICRSDPSRVWALGFPDPLLRSDDGGLTFVDSGAPPGFGGPETWCEMIAADPGNGDQILGGFNSSYCTGDCTYFGFVRRTTNSGVTWGDYFAPSGNYSFTEFVTGFDHDVNDGSMAYMSLGDGYGAVPVGFIRTTDHGATWNSLMSGLHGRAIGKVDHDGTGKVYARANARDGLWVAPSAGEVWTELPALQLEYYGWTDWQVNRGVEGLIEELGGHYSMDTFYSTYRRSTDGGLNWTAESTLPMSEQEGFCPTSYGTAVASDPISGQTVYVWVDACGNALCRSTDGGTTFDIVQVGGPAIVDAKIDPADPQRVFSMEWPYSGLVKLTTDGGVTWTSRSSGLPTGIPTGWGIALLMDSSNPDRLAAVYRTAGVYTTENAGLSWNAVVLPGYNGQTIVDADWDPDSNRFFLAIENGGAYLSGVGFISQGTITSTPTSISYEPLSKIVLLGTQYASVSLLDPGSVVDAPFISSAPQLEMAIHARPNPSRGQFDFDVHVGKEGAARISIVDVRGRRVAVPFEGRLDQGRHSIHWEANGSGASGRIVPGIYFAQIDTAGRSATTRLVILGQ